MPTPSKRPRKSGKQLTLPKTAGWGGRRRGAGRKRRDPGGRRSVAHARRPPHADRHPVHVTMRAVPGLPSFREPRMHRLFAEVLRDQRRRFYKDDFRVIHFSIQRDHLHLIVEADTKRARNNPLRAGISGLAIAFARRLNMKLGRRGKVWAHRYHRRDLESPTEILRGLGYVFDNYTHHGVRSYGEGVLDMRSSAWLFDGWDLPHVTFSQSQKWQWPVCRAETWLASRGYRRAGRLKLRPRP